MLSKPAQVTTPQELDFDFPVVNIGSHPDNDIVLSGQGVLPFHATLHLQNGQYQLIVLGNMTGIMVDGAPLSASPMKLGMQQRIQIGDFALDLRSNGNPANVHVLLSRLTAAPTSQTAGSAPAVVPDFSGENPILVNLPRRQAEVEVGQTAYYELEIINAGPIVAGFQVTTQGLPAEWVTVTPPMVNLYEGQRATVRITVTPPRGPQSLAGSHSLTVGVASVNYGGLSVKNTLTLVILPYYEFTIGSLSPRQQRIYWRKRSGVVTLPISNLGNSAADFNVSALDEENGCSFDFEVSKGVERSRQATLTIPAGESIKLPIEITPLKRPVAAFRSRSYHYTATVQVAQQASLSQSVSGTATSVPLIGWWTIVLTILLLLIGIFFLVQPNIYSYQVAASKDVIELGDTTRLEWSVSPFATRLNISGVDEAINYGQTSLTVAPTQSTSYELVAGNWLSGLLGLDQKKLLTVLVVPPSPRINTFEVSSERVDRGSPVTVRWSVTKATKAFLTIDQVVYELTPEKFSGEQEVVLEKDALVTLEAQSASGNELRSYYIDVVNPSITVKAFTVWVRAESSAMQAPASPNNGKLLSQKFAETAPDPNFPEKYVELVPDDQSDSGYRVDFLQPDRELSKGEQVMIEWNVEGVDKVQIAPFTDQLPKTGLQPFFPQESMNFVMTAKSGDLEGLYMLPVKVFDGIPPTAPKIEFFKGTPLSITGPGSVQFAWSVSGSWTRVQLSTENKVIADYLTPQGFKSVNVSKSGTYILTAWNGELSSAAPLDITINPALIDPKLIVTSIAPATGRAQVGSKIIVTIDFSAIPTNSAYPTGTVTVTDGSAICSIPLPALSCTLQFATSGTKSISASFPGDKIYSQSKSPAFGQQVIVASSQVELIPSFYFIGNDTPISVEGTSFDMDKGLRTIVEVRPKNTVLADNNGNISVSLCDQDINGVMQQDTCTFVGSAQVKVASTTANGQISGYGYADITIQNFNTSGKHGLLFEYAHSANAIDPASLFQPNVQINRARLILSLSYCTNPNTLTSCTFGLTSGVTTSELIFDLKIFKSPDPILLSTLLPAPNISAFSISSKPAASPSSTANVWDCSIKSISGTYKLVCKVTGLNAGTTYAVTYSYNNTDPLPVNPSPSTVTNNYYMGTDPALSFGTPSFQLGVLASTRVLIGDLSGVKVGERIHLTGPSGGLISILSGTTAVSPIPSTGITFEEKSGADIFGIINEGVNCALDSGNPGKIIVTAANADCDIFLKHVGNYTLVATFSGDTQLNGSTSSDTPITVLKQTQISTTLEYLGSGGPTFPGNFYTNTPAVIRAVLSGPDGGFPTSTTFPLLALEGRKLLLTLATGYSQDNCSLETGDLVVDKGGGIYELTITQKVVDPSVAPDKYTYIAAADFSVTCGTENLVTGLSFTLTVSDKTTPKDSDDFGFATSPVGLSTKAVSLPDLGNMTVKVNRRDTAKTNMLVTNNTEIDELHFGQLYDVSIDSSTDINVPYSYSYTKTDTYYWFFGWNYIGSSYSTSPSKASSDARIQKVNNYSTSAKWSVDPSNFLNGTNLLLGASTCTSNMSMVAKDNTSTVSERQNVYISDVNNYWGGALYYLDIKFTFDVNGTMQINLKSQSACSLVFDGANQNTAISSTNSGSIAVSAVSGDGLFDVNKIFHVNGIDKQDVSMTFKPSTGPIPGIVSGSVSFPSSIEIMLNSTDITGGTDLPFVTNFTTSFSPTLDTACPNLSQAGFISPSIKQDFTSTSAYASCTNTLQYLGNKYYKGVASQTQPTLTFTNHNSSVAFTAALPFGNASNNGAFTNQDYTNLKIKASDGDLPAHTALVPGGSVKVEVYNNSDTAYTCSDYTLTISPAVTCTSGAYTLPLTDGETAAFSIQFKTTMIGTGNYFKLSYVPITNDIFNASSTTKTAYPFTVKKHNSSVDFQTTPTFVTNGATKATAYTGLIIRVSDGDGHTTSLVPAGSVKIEVVNNTGNSGNQKVYSCSGNTPDYTISGPTVTCATDSYTLDLTNGSTNTFTITFNNAIPAGSGYYIRLTYTSSDDNFLGDTTNTAQFAIN